MKRTLPSVVVSMLLAAVLLFGCSADPQQGSQAPSESPASSSSDSGRTQTPSGVQASDYSAAANWLAVPDSTRHGADLIYFYPTCYAPESEADPTVCSIDNAGMRAGAQEKLLDQASAFETSADIYAPYYRQVDATSLAGLTQEEMIEAESGEPKADVFAALDYYFEHYNDGRPFMLAGHSQGSMMIYLILDEYMAEHPDRYERMVAAYMIGNAATKDWLEANPHVKMAQQADDTGVVVSWNTEGPGNKGKYNMVAPVGSVCINPLNWKTDATPAGVEENKGTLIQNDVGGYTVAEGVADATIDLERGTVICTTVDPATYAIPAVMEPLFGPESYHGWDYKFYYQNIRENAELRVEAFLSQHNELGAGSCSVELFST